MASFPPLPTGSPAHDQVCVGAATPLWRETGDAVGGDEQGNEGCPTQWFAEDVSWEPTPGLRGRWGLQGTNIPERPRKGEFQCGRKGLRVATTSLKLQRRTTHKRTLPLACSKCIFLGQSDGLRASRDWTGLDPATETLLYAPNSGEVYTEAPGRPLPSPVHPQPPHTVCPLFQGQADAVGERSFL